MATNLQPRKRGNLPNSYDNPDKPHPNPKPTHSKHHNTAEKFKHVPLHPLDSNAHGVVRFSFSPTEKRRALDP